jgi:putative membrane-bound dehydrogenase-like protein
LIAGCLNAETPPSAVVAAPDSPPGAAAGTDLFGPTRVWAIHIEVSAAEYQAMQPPAGFGFGGGPGAAGGPTRKPAAEKRPRRDSERNLFGLEFPWAEGQVSIDGVTLKRAGLRYAGNASYMASAGGLKRSFKIDLGRHVRQDLQGLRTINLQAGALDPTKMREALAFVVFRAAGVPAPRTAFAEVTLTVPGRYDKAYLGLYTVVEEVDARFLEDRFKTVRGLLVKPERLRGIDYLGEDWGKYKPQYQPRWEPTKDEADRLIAFARLIQQADDARFRKEIASYLDVEEFLRFMAATALLANADGFFTLYYNYSLNLDPASHRFRFIPGDQELALANFLMMGSPDQLMDMSLARPYGGENRLADRLMAIEDVSRRYKEILKELASTCFTKDRLLADAAAIEKVTAGILAREAKARAGRREPPAGFGPPGMPVSPDLRTFADKRTASIADQLQGKRPGYRPQFNFGPPGDGANQTPVDEKTIGDVVKAPPGFRVTLYAAPPKVGYPVALSASPSGELFVAVDEQGSLGRNKGGGKVLRCVDTDGDGKVDRVNVFATMEHPRGVIADGATVWVLHPPRLSVFRDTDGDGKSDRQEVLLDGLTTSMIDTRGGDHTTNGIRMGIDGWIYIADGDYGIPGARGTDGTTLSLRGGGILRVRPDGRELEVFATGLRNPFDIGIDPYLNLFTRDNTNDGAGWDVRVSHLIQTAHYGYTQLYANFPDEIMPPLGSFGQGGGTGSLFVQDERWPAAYRNTLYTGDWGRSEVYRHTLAADGATFGLRQEVFLRIPRPTGMDIDADGRLYVASWRGGEASVYVGPQVGFIARVTPSGLPPSRIRDWGHIDLAGLLETLTGPNEVGRLHAQREILRRGRNDAATRALVQAAGDRAKPLPGRVAALFTLKQLDGVDSHAALRKLSEDAAVREFALRALTDRKGEMNGSDARLFLDALADETPRVRAQALIGLGRLNDPKAAARIIPLTSRPKGSAMPTREPVHAQPDPDRVVPHLAVRALVSLGAVDACLEALDGPHRDGALWALRSMHNPRAVEGLIKKLGSVKSAELRVGILAALMRLYYREALYEGTWWGIRPDSTGPYYDPQEWELSGRIASVLESAVSEAEPETVAVLRAELVRNGVHLKGLPEDAETSPRPLAEERPIVIRAANPKDPDLIANMPYEVAARRALAARGDSRAGKTLFASQSCASCHTDADGQTPKGPHLVDIGRRTTPDELVESILKPSSKIAQGYESYQFATTAGQTCAGFVVSESADGVLIREATGVQRRLKRSDIEERRRQDRSIMPEGIVGTLTPEQLADLIAYLRSLN